MSAATPSLSPATLASLLETISDAVFALDGEWRFTYANQAASRFARFPREELIGSVIWDLYPDLGGTIFNTAVTKAMLERETVRFELHYEPFDITVEATAYPTEDGITVIAREVTGERGDDRLKLETAEPQVKLALGAAERTGQLYRTLAAAMPQFVWFTDAAGRARYLNERWYEYTGASHSEGAEAPSPYIHPEDRERVAPLWTESIASGTPFETELRIRASDGSYRWFLARAVPGFDGNGEILHWIGTSTDIEEQKLAEERSRRSESLLKQVIENLPIGLWILDSSGKVVQGNAAAREIWGEIRWIGPDDYDQFRAWRITTGEPVRGNEWPATRAIRGGEVTIDEELEIEAFDGKRKRILTSAIPILDGDQITGAIVLNRDVTQERRIGRETERLARRLEETHRIESLGRVAATMAHEINNILMGIQPMADYIERTATNPEMLSVAAQIARAMQRGKRVTEQILRYTRPATPLFAPVELGALLSRLASETAAMADSAIEYSLTLPGVPVRVSGDAAQLEQALRNVLFNARDAMPDGGTLDIALRTAGPNPPVDLPDGPWAEIAVADTGHGMSTEILFRIFEPFFTTRGAAGTGLGLAVAHQIITAHGGILHAASRPGEGTIFSLFLPVLEDEDAAIEGPEAVGEAREILLIEDDADVAEGLKMLLELEGKEVRVAGTAAEGLAMIREKLPSVVVLDVGLPDLEGTVLFDRIREIAPELPIIFSTGHSDAGRLARHRTEPKVGSLLKPYGIDELLKMIETVV
jgi:PAS domain S-box-containing protein